MPFAADLGLAEVFVARCYLEPLATLGNLLEPFGSCGAF